MSVGHEASGLKVSPYSCSTEIKEVKSLYRIYFYTVYSPKPAPAARYWSGLRVVEAGDKPTRLKLKLP